MSTRIVPPEWMPPAKAARIIIHWTAGAYIASALDRRHYHLLIEGNGNLVRGKYPINANDSTSDADGYAAHARGINTGSIGIALCGMAGATERPFASGNYPILLKQWDALIDACADLCERYGIPHDQDHLLSHAEVQSALNVPQRGKWDLSVTPLDKPMVLRSPRHVGDQIRMLVGDLVEAKRFQDYLAETAIAAPKTDTIPSRTARRIALSSEATIIIALPDDSAPALHLDPIAREITLTTRGAGA